MSGEFYIICYDSPNDKRRTKLHKLLKNYAVPVQKSVFETFLERAIFEKMMRKIEKLMNSEEDSVRIYSMSRIAQRQMKVIGYPGLLADPDYYIIADNTVKEPLKEGVFVEIEDDGELPEWL